VRGEHGMCVRAQRQPTFPQAPSPTMTSFLLISDIVWGVGYAVVSRGGPSTNVSYHHLKRNLNSRAVHPPPLNFISGPCVRSRPAPPDTARHRHPRNAQLVLHGLACCTRSSTSLAHDLIYISLLVDDPSLRDLTLQRSNVGAQSTWRRPPKIRSRSTSWQFNRKAVPK
jgi:hypothetical protein